jgi:hypothetical protein
LVGIYNSSSDDKIPGIEIKITATDDDDDFLLDSSFNDVGDIDDDFALIDLKRLLMIFFGYKSLKNHNLKSPSIPICKIRNLFFSQGYINSNIIWK